MEQKFAPIFSSPCHTHPQPFCSASLALWAIPPPPLSPTRSINMETERAAKKELVSKRKNNGWIIYKWSGFKVQNVFCKECPKRFETKVRASPAYCPKTDPAASFIHPWCDITKAMAYHIAKDMPPPYQNWSRPALYIQLLKTLKICLWKKKWI